MESDHIYEQVWNFVNEMNLIRPNKLSKNTKIEKDLGISGDDAIEFIEKFSQTFKVDTSSLKFNEYFAPEGGEFSRILSFLFSLGDRTERKELTLGDLEQAIIKGKLE